MERNDDHIRAHCPTCHDVETVISGWQEALWAAGPMDPVTMTDD